MSDRDPRPDGPPDEPARPRVLAACAVLVAVGLAILAAVGFLVYAAVKIFQDVGGPDRGEAPPPAELRAGGWGRPDPVTPTKLAKDRDRVVLPEGEYDAVCRGGGGRYLVLRVPAAKKLYVFDPVEAKVAAEVPLRDPAALFAASASKLFVYQAGPQQARLGRYDLRTGRKEKEAEPKDDGPASHLLTGYGVDGPVRLVGAAVVAADGATAATTFDPRTLAVTDEQPGWKDRYGPPLRVSADGRFVGAIGRGLGPRTGVVVAVGGGLAELRMTPDDVPVGHVSPSPDGRWAYTAYGPYERAGGGYHPVARGKKGPPAPLYSFPTAHGGDLYLSLDGPVTRPTGPLRLHLAGETRPVAELDVVGPDRRLTGAEERVHLWPAAGLLAVLTAAEGRTTVELSKVDVGAALKEGGRDHLVFASDPPTTAVRGSRWTYRPTFWSSRPGVPVDVTAAGTDGLTAGRLGDDPVVTWMVPRDFPQAEAELRLEATLAAPPVPQPLTKRVPALKATQTVRVTVLDPEP